MRASIYRAAAYGACTVVAIAAAVFLSCGWWLGERERPRALSKSPAAVAPAGALEPLAPREPDVGEVSGPRPEVAEDPQGTWLEGTLVVVDAEGARHEEEDGSFVLVFWRGHTGVNSPPVAVEKGRWKAALPPDEAGSVRIGIVDVVAGGKHAFVDQEKIPLPVEGLLEIVAVWSRGVRLKVIGADTRSDLAEVTVLTTTDWRRERFEHPGAYAEADVIVRDEPSPVDMAPLAGRFPGRAPKESVVWVRTAGYAWGRSEVDFEEGGERLVVLKRGADLEITLVNQRVQLPGERSPVLRLRPLEEPELPPGMTGSLDDFLKAMAAVPDDELPAGITKERLLADLTLGARGERPGTPVAEVAPALEGPTLLEGLLPGTYFVQAEVGEWFKEPLVLATTKVELTEGQRESVALELAEPPSLPPRVPLEGTDFLPPAWGERRLSLSFEPMDLPHVDSADRISISFREMEPERTRPGLYRWRAGDVVPGKYEAEIHAFQLQQVIDVGPEGKRDAEIKIGEPATVIVRVFDAETGKPIEAQDMHWNCRRPAGVTGGGLNSAQRESETGRYSFLAPAGPIEISTWPDAYAHHREVIQASPGPNEVTVRLERSCGLIVVVAEGGQSLPYDMVEKQLKVKEVEGSGQVTGWRGDKSAKRLTLGHPGLYEVTLSKLDGYEAVEPVRLQIARGEFLEHAIELRRER